LEAKERLLKIEAAQNKQIVDDQMPELKKIGD